MNAQITKMKRLMHRFRFSECYHDQSGQIMILMAFLGLILVIMVATIYNVGVYTGVKMQAQNAADAAAYSQAIWEARVYNFLAYSNRTIIAQINTIAFLTAFHSMQALWEDFKDALSPYTFLPPIEVLYDVVYVVEELLQVLADATGPWRNVIRDLYNPALIAEQKMMIQMFSLASRSLMQEVTQRIDRNLEVIDPMWMKQSRYTHTNISTFNADQFRKYVKSQKMEFKELKKVMEKSRDLFTKGDALPRKFHIPGMDVIDFPGTPFRPSWGVGGNSGFQPDQISTKDYFYLALGVKIPFTNFIRPVKKLIELGPSSHYDYPDLAEIPFTTYYSGKDGTLYPSVYAVVRKQAQHIHTLNFFSGIKYDVTAMARAEVFYWDPDKKRQKKLNDRIPNFWNPFWNARLAAIEPSHLNGSLDYTAIITH